MATAATSQMYGFDAIPGDAALLSYLPLAHIYGVSALITPTS